MSYAEFIDWMTYYSIEPFGGLRDDLHAAQVVAMIANVNRNPKKHKAAYKVSEFMLDWWKDKDDPGAAHAANLLAKFQMLAGDALNDTPEEITISGAKHRDALRQANE